MSESDAERQARNEAARQADAERASRADEFLRQQQERREQGR